MVFRNPDICDYPEYFKELGIEKGKYVLGMCRFVPEKNLHHLIEAFCKVKNEERRVKNRRVTFIIVSLCIIATIFIALSSISLSSTQKMNG